MNFRMKLRSILSGVSSIKDYRIWPRETPVARIIAELRRGDFSLETLCLVRSGANTFSYLESETLRYTARNSSQLPPDLMVGQLSTRNIPELATESDILSTNLLADLDGYCFVRSKELQDEAIFFHKSEVVAGVISSQQQVISQLTSELFNQFL